MPSLRFALPATLLAAAALALAAPLAASAHVTLDDDTADPNSYTLLTFTVPNESGNAATDRVIATLPEEFASARYVPTPGWTTTVADGTVTWAADPDSAIGVGELQLFTLSVGPVPDVDTIELPVQQRYDDGTVVDWNGENDHPAPVLYVNAAPTDDHAETHTDAETDAGGDTDHATTATTTDAGTVDVLARVFGVLGLLVGAVGVVLAVLARRSRA
jgi:uncharacterized protein YcnI